MLKQYLIKEQEKIEINQTMKKEISDNLFTKSKKSSSWLKKLLLLSPVPALVLVGVLLFKQPAAKNQPSNFLVDAQEVYEQEIKDNIGKVLHQKVQVPAIDDKGVKIDGHYWINEIWKSTEGEVAETRDENGILLDKWITLYNQDGQVIGTYVLPKNDNSEEDEMPCPDPDKTLYCNSMPQINEADQEKFEASEKLFNPAGIIDSAVGNPDQDSREQVLNEIFNADNITDLGVKDNVHTFSMTRGDGMVSEYQFSDDTHKLLKYSQNDGYAREYLIDEYLNNSINDIEAFTNRDNLEDYLATHDTCQYQEIKKMLQNKPEGCYDKNGEYVSSVQDVNKGIEDQYNNLWMMNGDNQNSFFTWSSN